MTNSIVAFIRRHPVAVFSTAMLLTFLVSFSSALSVQNLRAQVSSGRLQKELADVRRERDATLGELNQAVARASATAALTTQAQKKISATAEGAEAHIADLLQKVQAIDGRLRDFETMIGTDDRVKVLMTTTAMAQEIAARKQFQDSTDSKLSELKDAIRSDVGPIREKLETLQNWLISSLLGVIVALGGVIWLLIRRAAALYGVVTATVPRQAD